MAYITDKDRLKDMAEDQFVAIAQEAINEFDTKRNVRWVALILGEIKDRKLVRRIRASCPSFSAVAKECALYTNH